MKRPPPLTLVIRSCTSVIKVHGKRAKNSYRILKGGGASAEFIATRKHRDEAIQTALDCAAENINAVYLLHPV